MRNSSRFLGILLAVALATAPIERAVGASGPIDYSGKEWPLDGSVKAKAKGVGSQTTKGSFSVEFDETNFALTDAQGDELDGTYLSDAKGKALLTPDTGSLLAYIAIKIQKGFQSAGLEATVGEITTTSVKGASKATSVATGLKLVLGIKIKAEASVTVGGETQLLKVGVDVKGKGLLETPVGGTSWVVPLLTKLSLQGLGSAKGEDTLRLDFGPNVGEGLGEGQFKGSFAGGDEIVGIFTTDGKKKVDIEIQDGSSSAGLEAGIKALVEARVGGTLTNLLVDILDAKAAIKVTHGLAISFSLKLKFEATGDVDGVPGGSGGSYATKGKGTLD